MTIYPTIRRTFIQYNTGTYTVGTGWSLGPVFDVVTECAPYSKFKVFYQAPFRDDADGWGGAYVELQMSINGGTWQSLGASGYDGGVMKNGAASIGTYNNMLLIDPGMTTVYSIQFRMYLRSYNATAILNGSHSMNATSGTASWDTIDDNLYQHYCHLILEELST